MRLSSLFPLLFSRGSHAAARNCPMPIGAAMGLAVWLLVLRQPDQIINAGLIKLRQPNDDMEWDIPLPTFILRI